MLHRDLINYSTRVYMVISLSVYTQFGTWKRSGPVLLRARIIDTPAGRRLALHLIRPTVAESPCPFKCSAVTSVGMAINERTIDALAGSKIMYTPALRERLVIAGLIATPTHLLFLALYFIYMRVFHPSLLFDNGLLQLSQKIRDSHSVPKSRRGGQQI